MTDQDGPIYSARYVSGASSSAYSGPIYNPGAPIQIDDGYPMGLGRLDKEVDRRKSTRLEVDLLRLGLLRNLSDQELGAHLGNWSRRSMPLWQKVDLYTNVWAPTPDQLFVLGKPCNASIYFSFSHFRPMCCILPTIA